MTLLSYRSSKNILRITINLTLEKYVLDALPFVCHHKIKNEFRCSVIWDFEMTLTFNDLDYHLLKTLC